jgi:uncharacterized BrkB/YihY/UPF0761 family membrane protein
VPIFAASLAVQGLVRTKQRVVRKSKLRAHSAEVNKTLLFIGALVLVVTTLATVLAVLTPIILSVYVNVIVPESRELMPEALRLLLFVAGMIIFE